MKKKMHKLISFRIDVHIFQFFWFDSKKLTGRPKKLKIQMFFIPNLAREVDGSSNLEKLFQPEFRYLKQPASPIAHATLSFQKFLGFHC